MTTTPVAKNCQKEGTFRSVSPFRIAPRVRAPTTEPSGLPSPPKTLAPPITAAPMACSSRQSPPSARPRRAPLTMGGKSLPPTKKKVVGRGSHIAKVSGGKIVEYRTHPDVAGLMMQLGMMPGM
jgi:hypothetical protein